jgi:hypothetical protein
MVVPAALPRRHVYPADTCPGLEHLVRGTVEPGHVAAGKPLDASREAVRGQRPDDQLYCECSGVDVDGCQRLAGTILVRRQRCQHPRQAMDTRVSRRAQQPLVNPPEFSLRYSAVMGS